MYASLLSAALVFTQDTSAVETPPFRRGQWAAQFQGGSSFGSLGFIKFRSPTRALVLDVRLGGSHSELLHTDSAGTRFAGLQSLAFTQLRFGWRRYAGGSAKTVAHYSLGVLAGFTHNVSASPGGESSTNAWTAGVFGDVGGTYLLTSKFGIGALAAATLSYTSDLRIVSPPKVRQRSWSIGGSAVTASLVATIFF
jgi:hypothetical protein